MSVKKGFSDKKVKIVDGEEIVKYTRRRRPGSLAPGGNTLYGRPAFFAYEIVDPTLPAPVRVLNSGGAWWMNKYKVEKLIDAYKMDCKDSEAAYFAGVSQNQLRYFKDKHPEFDEIIKHCKSELSFYARKNIAHAIKYKKSSHASAEYLDRKEREAERKKNPLLGAGIGAVIQNNGVIFMDFSKPGQTEPELIDTTTIYEAEVDEVIETDNDAKS